MITRYVKRLIELGRGGCPLGLVSQEASMRNDAVIHAAGALLQATGCTPGSTRQPNPDYCYSAELDRTRQNLEYREEKPGTEPAPAANGGIRNILVAFKDVRYELPVIQYAGQMARQLGAELTILHVIDRGVDYWTEITLGNKHNYDDDHRIALELVEHARKSVLPAVAQTAIREGNPATEILALADTTHANLIVVGTHGPGRLEQLFMGSVAVTVVREAHCPVIVINHRTVNELTYQHEESAMIPG